MIWEPFVMALVLGLLVSAGLYFAYLWPSVEPVDEDDAEAEPAAKPTPGPAILETPAAEEPRKVEAKVETKVEAKVETKVEAPEAPEPPEPSKSDATDPKPSEGA